MHLSTGGGKLLDFFFLKVLKYCMVYSGLPIYLLPFHVNVQRVFLGTCRHNIYWLLTLYKALFKAFYMYYVLLLHELNVVSNVVVSTGQIFFFEILGLHICRNSDYCVFLEVTAVCHTLYHITRTIWDLTV